MRLFDRLIGGQAAVPPWAAYSSSSEEHRVDEAIQRCGARVLADNVADYYLRNGDELKPEDLPCLAPPFEDIFWVEAKIPREHALKTNAEAIGGLFLLYEPAGYELFQRFDEEDERDVYEAMQAATWAMEAYIAVQETNGKVWFPAAVVQLPIDGDGAYLLREGNSLAFHTSSLVLNRLRREMVSGISKEWADQLVEANQGSVASIFPLLLAIAFMHCRNVQLVERQPDAKLSRAHQRRHKRPLVTFKVLKIDPMVRVLEGEGEAGTKGLKHALHICRGHFKDYTGRGLFGKYKGRYWWPQHLRGSLKQGVVIKDYDVKPPRETEQQLAERSDQDASEPGAF